MADTLYHGSVTPDIRRLNAVSPLHGAADTKVVYLTANPAYALFYIWDAAHNLKPGKHVTCRLKDGVVYYEEQFPGQLEAFYSGVSGWLYSIERRTEFSPMPGRESMWYSAEDAPIAGAAFIPDVCAEILRLADEGRIKIIRHAQVDPERLKLLYEHMAQMLAKEGTAGHPEAKFYAAFFPEVWAAAQDLEHIQ